MSSHVHSGSSCLSLTHVFFPALSTYGLDEATKDRHGQAAVCWLAGPQGLFLMESSASSGSPVPFGNIRIVVRVESTCGSCWVYSCLHSQSPMWLCGGEGDRPFLLPLLGINPALRKWEQILPFMSLWDCIFPQVKMSCLMYGLEEPGEIQGCLDINHFRKIRLC